MFVLGLGGFVFSAVQLVKMGVPWFPDIVLRALDVITITVPPALPVAMTVGTSFAIARLKRRKVFCISPPRVNVSGMIKLFCFDKTGTLTEDGLDLYGVRPVTALGTTQFCDLVEAEQCSSDLSQDYSRLFELMTTCHSLTFVNGTLVGDPLELKIFEATKWVLEEPRQEDYSHESAAPTIVRPPASAHVTAPSPKDSFEGQPLIIESEMARYQNVELGIIKKFDFMSSLQRMSCVVKNLATGETVVFVKGSPEKIRDCCRPETLPADFSKVLYEYAHEGYRVIGCGYKILQGRAADWRRVQRMSREDADCDLTFLGLIVMQNKLKGDTTKVIRTLKQNKIRSVMVTGDNPYTSISVARQCSMIDPSRQVFLAYSVKETEAHPLGIEWKDIDGETELDPYTL
jgi:cation-transporting P-type ATPase 13A2